MMLQKASKSSIAANSHTLASTLCRFNLYSYSGVPNKRGGENNRGGGLEMAQYNSNRGGWNNRGGLGEIENSRFLR